METEGIKSEIISNMTTTNRLGSCEVCNENESKYTCPRCEIKTCCLKCSKIHKKDLECSGIRDRAKFIPIKKMTSMDFMNDYYFLEEATSFTKHIKSNPNVNKKNCLNFKFVKLKKEAFKRNVKLFFLNNGLSKRRKNRSIFRSQEETIFWQTEFIFPNAENVKIIKSFNENLIMKDILETLLESISENENLLKKLEFYKAEGSTNLSMLLKAEGIKKCKTRFYRINPDQSLKSNLENKVIIEYPTILVVLNHSSYNFDVIDSDDEDQVQNEIKHFRQTLHSEVLSKKVGENPPVAELRPEEVPLVATMFSNEIDGDTTANYKMNKSSNDNNCNNVDITTPENSDDTEEINPKNYFF